MNVDRERSTNPISSIYGELEYADNLVSVPIKDITKEALKAGLRPNLYILQPSHK